MWSARGERAGQIALRLGVTERQVQRYLLSARRAEGAPRASSV
jgi:DNA-binding CsgD family transcriptional regulator